MIKTLSNLNYKNEPINTKRFKGSERSSLGCEPKIKFSRLTHLQTHNESSCHKQTELLA